MLQQKSKIKDIEYYIKQVEMLSMNDEEEAKLSKIIALKDFIDNESIKELISEDLKDETWLESTKVLINTCNKRLLKSAVLLEHVKQCRNFMVYRYIEDKLLYVKEIIFDELEGAFKEIDLNGKQTDWINSKFIKSFSDSEMPSIFVTLTKNSQLTINSDWLYKNKELFFTEEIFEDIDFLIKKKRKV